MTRFSKQKINKLGDHLNELYIPERLPGCSVLINYNNEEVYYYETGLSDLKRKKNINRDSIFRIYSMTKPLTSMGIMLLLEEGKIKIEDEVEKYIPEWKDLSVYQSGSIENLITEPPKRKMIIHDLLTHRSGLTYHFNESAIAQLYLDKGVTIARSPEKLSPDEYIKIISDIPLEFSPGEYFNYSISTDILGFIIERISGMTLEEYLSEKIIDPLGMNDTTFHIDKSKLDRLSSCYIYDEIADKYILQDDSVETSYLEKPRSFSGGGGLLSTIDDYMKFCNLIQNNGSTVKENIIGSRTLDYMMSNQLNYGEDLHQIGKGRWGKEEFKGVGFSLGGSVVIDPVENMSIRSKGEFAWGGAASTAFWIDKKENISVVFMTQMLSFPYSDSLRKELRTLVYQALI
tara:strand:+ start:2485 stop:3690 length:1206 start_codon:yes stop_codon:yes gene_type:complete